MLGFHHNVGHLEMKTRLGNIVWEAGNRENVRRLATNLNPAFLLVVRYNDLIATWRPWETFGANNHLSYVSQAQSAQHKSKAATKSLHLDTQNNGVDNELLMRYM